MAASGLRPVTMLKSTQTAMCSSQAAPTTSSTPPDTRIGPQEVENALASHPSVKECAVVGIPDEARGELVKAWIVLKDGIEQSEALVKELQNHVRFTTAPYKYPRSIAFTDDLPKTVSGKIRRNMLRERN